MSKIFNKRDFFVLVVGILASVIGFIYIQFGVGDEQTPVRVQQPIIFVSDQNKTSSAARHLVTTTSRSGGSVAMHVDIFDDGKIEYLANKNVKQAKQPIIEISFSDRNNTTKEQAAQLKKVLNHLNHKYHYESYDAIGFGSGALAVYYNAINYGTKENKMGLDYFISIAGPYKGVIPEPVRERPVTQEPGKDDHRTNPENGVNHQMKNNVAANGRTNGPNLQNVNDRFPSFEELQKKSKNLDDNTQILNIYGVLSDKDRSDGRVSEDSATAIKKLVKADSYQSLRLTGPYALHTNILDNQIAERLVNRFLFND
ncbi:alpha/beta hydrolase [Fructilactobacillus vespulae]|uniref:alpha/beta hydrolase n=1 Tax=Fructilactobacillus vespulae TaxID=1249630 RepID=UPI0039B57E16